MGGTRQSLQGLLDDIGDVVEYFYNDTRVQHLSQRSQSALYIPPEFTNWQEEQRAQARTRTWSWCGRRC